MQFELTTEYLDKLKEAIEEKNADYLNEQLHELYAPDIAEIINLLRVTQAAYIYELLDDETAPNVSKIPKGKIEINSSVTNKAASGKMVVYPECAISIRVIA